MQSLHHCSINTSASVSVVNISRLSNLSLILPLNDSIYPFSRGLPGSIYTVSTPILHSHFPTVLAVNSGPLSERTYSGIPLRINISNSLSITSCEVIFLFTTAVRHSLVYPSIISSILNAFPLGKSEAKSSYTLKPWLMRF